MLYFYKAVTNRLRSIRYYLSERFRLRFEDAGIDEMMDETEEIAQGRNGDSAPCETRDTSAAATKGDASQNVEEPDFQLRDDEATDVDHDSATIARAVAEGQVRTLDGAIAGDEFAGDAVNYQILLGKIDGLLDRLRLDA